MSENNTLILSTLKVLKSKRDIINSLEREWDRLDNEGASAAISRQNDITKELDKLNAEVIDLEIDLQNLGFSGS